MSSGKTSKFGKFLISVPKRFRKKHTASYLTIKDSLDKAELYQMPHSQGYVFYNNIRKLMFKIKHKQTSYIEF